MVSKEKGKNKSKTPISSATEGSKPVEGDATFKCHPTGTLVRVYAKPGARRADVSGITEDGINIAIDEEPTEGKANEGLVEFISEIFGVRKSNVTLSRGHRGRNKVFLVEGVDPEETRRRYDTFVGSQG